MINLFILVVNLVLHIWIIFINDLIIWRDMKLMKIGVILTVLAHWVHICYGVIMLVYLKIFMTLIKYFSTKFIEFWKTKYIVYYINMIKDFYYRSFWRFLDEKNEVSYFFHEGESDYSIMFLEKYARIRVGVYFNKYTRID